MSIALKGLSALAILNVCKKELIEYCGGWYRFPNNAESWAAHQIVGQED
jgi:hypothetical protein